jgi:competence protein ComEA
MKALLLACSIAFALGARGPAKAPRDPVDLNTATATELMQLPRVGARTAARIIEFRKAHGPFQRPEELMNVKGIGEKAFLRLKPHVRTGTAP